MPRKQSELPGTESLSITEIEEAADAYVTIRDKRMKLTGQEVVAKNALIQAMIAHESDLDENGDGDKVYRFDDEIVILKSGKRNVKVKAAHEDEEDDED